METTTTLIKHTDTTWTSECLYCSQSSGDQLVGMWRWDTDTRSDTGKVMRYDNTGKCIHTIPFDDDTHHTLYEYPIYITENNNRDVLVSDYYRGVIVTSREGIYRFSYAGPPSSGSGLAPRGICTDHDVTHHGVLSDYQHRTDV